MTPYRAGEIPAGAHNEEGDSAESTKDPVSTGEQHMKFI